jgi:hypothetical protein
MDFARGSTPRAADRLGPCPPFPPAAERCASRETSRASTLLGQARRRRPFQTAAAKSRAAATYYSDCRSCVRAVRGGRILPAAANFQHVQNAADHPAVIHPRLARLPVRQVGFDPRPGSRWQCRAEVFAAALGDPKQHAVEDMFCRLKYSRIARAIIGCDN